MTLGSAAAAAWSTGASLERPPTALRTDEVVTAVRHLWARCGTSDCESHMRALGWSVEYRQLEASSGGHQALLLPRLGGGFHIVIDPEPSPAQRRQGVTSVTVRRWRLAHEYAHTFFYVTSDVPRLAAPASADEEAFCDAFANQVLRTSLSSRRS